MKYEAVIGLEVHTQLRTRSKMYCRCSSDYVNAPPNTHVCPVCLGMPGVLPVINKQAVEYTMMAALALNCTIAEYTKFDRKNYSYPDLMKGYQISQYDTPIGRSGRLTIQVDGQEKKVGITRVHLEEDVAKLVHRTSVGESYSLVDVNRSGVPLMEIVGEPDLRFPEEARQYLMKLHSILQYLDVSTASMEEGSFRCDANVSIRPEGSSELLAKVEVKNMNSFRAVFRALEYEVKRQTRAIETGEKVVQETRGWVEENGETVSQRSKEFAHDYRYFPEPDLLPLNISRTWVAETGAKLPELPEARHNRFVTEYGLSLYDANLLTSSKEMADYFENLCQGNKIIPAKTVSNWLLGTVSAILNTNNIDMSEFADQVSTERVAELLLTESKGVVSTATAKSILEEMYKTGKSSSEIIAVQGLTQISDTGELEKIAAQVIQVNAPAVADYKAGKAQSLTFLVGQVMRMTQGRANPRVVTEVLKKKLEEEGEE
ncbi:MAG: Asp-tRNA(Asn)/Glu-tRNA(Gln) amidotransferase GatCAB subunit B [Dehalococcoidales bacterium]|nr:Asp-tRNA(Asn)/Glu-tRNA(Gln) amidotransferase GatCAB subunit B [Dehalococcoidales bacterium]MDP7109620.1 Asp-tRNA(Asn)/Glu-tRNA(Gln) amidotransferase subunit GatB [Dehalococcoidales bacterium]MDP7310031.1 Asp-tRNA(Asn)/Glu-tRNA(Gln) amidotransferase subunit GatB [Dehalococcoidales bacterium]MDP7409553.1 Asp-tRNA(Asn)/Glu-tRNA(Gln) amidotransferase subunit GatB [Dehalococcoidales bacterium]MDP7675887.1 Asp-tRNA(Asn)/Glu-tRNA(Gln) amidotransferase subunit GatB [Dehalococcoidales bacterium]